jgi:hypothetical protein
MPMISNTMSASLIAQVRGYLCGVALPVTDQLSNVAARSIELVEEESGSGQVVARDSVTIVVSDRHEVGLDEFLSPEEVEEFESAIG